MLTLQPPFAAAFRNTLPTRKGLSNPHGRDPSVIVKEEHIASCFPTSSTLKKTSRSKPTAEEHSVSMGAVGGQAGGALQ